MVLSHSSVLALNRLRSYTPPPTQWYNCPLTRRAAVLILLFPDRHGELKVVLTMRSAKLRSYAGQVALPGGKSDTLEETPFDTARREASEEIGLPMSDDKLQGFKIDHLCELPANLALTELGVRPCVAFLYPSSMSTTSPSVRLGPYAEELPSVEDKLIPRLNPGEVAAVFTAPFHAFLRKEWTGDGSSPSVQKNGKPEKWYQGGWTTWHASKWRMHNFYIPRPATFPTTGPAPSSPSPSAPLPPPSSEQPPPPATTPTRSSPHLQQQQQRPEGDDPRPEPAALADLTTFRVFGMTARILVDAARVAYGEEPDFEHNSDFGDEALMARLLKMGRLSEEKVKGEVLTKEVLREASSSKI